MKVLMPQVLLICLGSWNYNNNSSFSSTRIRLELPWIPDVLMFFCEERLNGKWSNFKIRYLTIPVLYPAVNVVPNLYPWDINVLLLIFPILQQPIRSNMKPQINTVSGCGVYVVFSCVAGFYS